MLKALEQFRHRRFRRDLSAYVDDILSEKARRRLEAHLRSCEACRQELAELRATVEAMGSLPMAEVPRSFTLAAAPVAEVRPRPVVRRLEFGLRLATATAAFALALVVVGDFAGLPGGGEQEEEKPSGMLLSANQETPAAPEATPVGTPEPAATWSRDVPGITEGPPPVPTAAEEGIFEFGEEAQDKAVDEGAGVEEEAETYADGAQAVGEEEGGGLSREDVVRWLEIGLGAGVGILVVLWVFARFRRGIGGRA